MHSDPDPYLSRRALRRVVTQAFAIIALLLAVTLIVEGPGETARPWQVRVVSFLILIIFGIGIAEAYLRLTTRWWPSGHVPVPINVTTAILGSITGFCIAEFASFILGSPGATLTWATVVEVLVAGPVWILLIGTAVLTRWRYLTERDSLLVELIRTEAVRQRESGLVDASRAALRAPIFAFMASAREGVSHHIAQALSSTQLDLGNSDTQMSEARDTAVALRHTALTIIRPLSHEIWKHNNLPPSPRQPVRFLARVISTQFFRPGLVAAVYVASALAASVTLYGVGTGILRLATDVAFIFIVLGAANIAMRKWDRAHTALYISTLLVIHVVPLLPFVVGPAEEEAQPSIAGRIAEILISLALIIGTSSLGLLREGRDARLAILRQEVDAEWLQRAAEAHDITAYARALATTLHGTVQSTLLTAAAAIDIAVDNRDAATVTRVLAEVTKTLDALPDLDALETNDTTTLMGHLDIITNSWQELCTLTLDVDAELCELTGETADAVAAVVREGVANSFRHGEASHIDIRVHPHDHAFDASSDIQRAPSGRAIVITVSDDGVGPGDKIWGLGLTTIDRASGGHWTLTRDGAWTVLHVEIPVSS
jgi:signal transduction histidine kinase